MTALRYTTWRFFAFAIFASTFAYAGLQSNPAPASAQELNAPPKKSNVQPRRDSNATPEIDWHDVTEWGVEGRILADQPRKQWFDRLPASAEGKVTPAVWNLSRDSAGMVVRFETEAPEIHVHYRLKDGDLAMPHMPATGVSGLDLYARDANGEWRWVQVVKPGQRQIRTRVIRGLKPGRREYAFYLPLYNGVEFLKIGVPTDVYFKGLPPRQTKPIVFYGTSITHGACASRPGMNHTAILGRRFDRPFVNMGFSGNGRMDLAVADYLIQVDAAVYVIDCLPNMNPQQVRQKCVPLVKRIRESRPDTPIVLVEDRRFTNAWILPQRQRFHDENHAALREALEALQSEGIDNLYYLEGDELYGTDGEGATDGSHASDLGFMRQADQFETVLRPILDSAR